MTSARARGRRGRTPARERAPADPPRAPEPLALEEVRRKYRELCEKYEALVARSSAEVTDRVGIVALALSAMRTSPSALALARAGQLLFTNTRAVELLRSQDRLVRVAGPDALPTEATARQLADAGAAAVLAPRAAEAVAARYEAERGGAAWDFRFERTRYRGRPVAMIAAVDATGALRADRELEAARGRMAEQERLRTVGLLAAGVAHDFANALNGAGIHLAMIAADDAALPEPVRRHVHALRRIHGGMAERTKRLRELALERHELSIDRVELLPVVTGAVELARAEFRSHATPPARVEIVVEPGIEGLPAVRGAAAEIVHVLVNLLLNARDAMREDGEIRVSGAAGPDTVTLEVADEGPGIPEELLSRVFEPFFTTKGQRGTGLGLATAYGLMRTLGGEITAANRPSGGAVLSLRFRRWE